MHELESRPENPDSELRRDERRPVELAAYLVRSNKKIIDVKVVDLSYDGCAIYTVVPLVPGEKIKLSVLGRGAISAVVRWYSGRRAGLLFQGAPPSRTRWPRKAERIDVSAEISLRRSGRVSFRVAVLDVTRFGCRCEFVERPTTYEHVTVKFDGLQAIPAVVCWIEEFSLGVMFKNPLHPAVFDLLVTRLNPTPIPMESDGRPIA